MLCYLGFDYLQIWPFVLVCLGCYNYTIDQVTYKEQKLFLTVLQAGKSKIKILADSVSDESFWFIDGCFHVSSSLDRRGEGGALWGPFYIGTDVIYKVSTLWHNHFPKASHLNTLILGVRVSTYEFWGDINIQSITLLHLMLIFFFFG